MKINILKENNYQFKKVNTNIHGFLISESGLNRLKSNLENGGIIISANLSDFPDDESDDIYKEYDKWLELNGDNITDFYDFIQNKNYIYAKYDLKSKNDTKKIKIDLKNYTTVYNDLYLSKMTILESAIKQDEVLDRLNPNNLSFIRFPRCPRLRFP